MEPGQTKNQNDCNIALVDILAMKRHIKNFKKITTFFNLKDMFQCYEHHCQLENTWKTIGTI